MIDAILDPFELAHWDRDRQVAPSATPPPAEPPAPFSLDQIGGLTSLNEQIAIAEAGLGGDRTALLRQKRALLRSAFDRSRSQSERAAIASEIANVDAALGSADGGGAVAGGGGGGSMAGGGASGGPTTITNTLNLTVEGNVVTERELGDHLLRLFVEWARSGRQPLAQIGFGG